MTIFLATVSAAVLLAGPPARVQGAAAAEPVQRAALEATAPGQGGSSLPRMGENRAQESSPEDAMQEDLMQVDSTFPGGDPELAAKLLAWQQQAPEPVRAEIDRLESGSATTKIQAARQLAGMGAQARGAILALVRNWSWRQKRPERPDRLTLTRMAAEERKLRANIGRAMVAIGADAVEPLVAALGVESPLVREEARVLSEIRDPKAVPPLLAALAEEAPLVRSLAAEALGGIGDEQAVDGLAAALADGDEEVRERAGQALAAIGTARAVEVLLAGLGDEQPEVREAAAALSRVKSPAAVAALVAALGRGDELVLRHAATALGNVGEARAVPALLPLLIQGDFLVHEAALEALEDLDPQWTERQEARSLVPSAIEALRDQDAAVRERAVETLEQLRDPRAVEPLIGVLQDDGLALRAEAARVLGGLGDARAVEPLLQAFAGESSPLRDTLAGALARLGDARAVEPLASALAERRPDSPYRALPLISALELLGDARAVAALVTVVRAPEDGRFGFQEVIAAIGALGEIGDPRAVDDLRAVSESHWTDGTRVAGMVPRAARAAMAKIQGGPGSGG